MTPLRWGGRLRALCWLIPVLAIGFPLLRLLPLDGQFAVDWYNHKWLAAFSGEYLRHHGTVPVVINTPEYVGMPYPVFYGTLFYPLLSLITAWFNPGTAIRLVVLVVTGLQFRLVTRAFTVLEVPRWIAMAIACLVIWAIYPLTNLYNRAAITEYVATALLTCIVASFFLLVHAKQPAERFRIGLGIGLLFVLVAGTHPITALYSMPVLGLLLLAAYAEHGLARAFWWGLFKALALPTALVLAVLGQWIYALSRFQDELTVAKDGGPWFYKGIDDWTTRFCPIPHDARIGLTFSDLRPPDGSFVSSPFLDAQVNVAMLVLLVGWLAILWWRDRVTARAGLRATAFALIAFAFFTWISMYPSAFELLPAFTRMLQLAYRAVSYENISVLLAIFLLAGLLRRRRDRSLFEAGIASRLLIGCLVLSGAGVIIQSIHASQILQTSGSRGIRATDHERGITRALPKSFYGATAYATIGLYEPLSQTERESFTQAWVPVGEGDSFGITQPLHITQSRETWVATNVQAFPWNVLELDGVRIPADQLRVDEVRLVVRVPAGIHTLKFLSVPDPIWRVLRVISFVVLALWFAGFTYLTVRARRRSHPVTA